MTIFINAILFVTLAYLLYCSVWDIIFQATPQMENFIMLAIAFGTFIFTAIEGTFTWAVVPILIAFTIINLIPILSKKMGEGDGYAYLSCMLVLTSTSFLSGINNAWLFVISWFISNLIFVLYGFITHKKGVRPIPMLPFITIGYILSLIIYFN